MVLITLDLLARCINQRKRRKDESVDRYLRRATHLQLNTRSIDEISGLEVCASIRVLYLYENNIRRIANLSWASTLTNLYLQKNQIELMENLSDLRALEKLYLGYNGITLVEGVGQLTSLRELHLEQQQLPLGEQLLFDPVCLHQLSTSLTVINISGNGLTTLQPIACLTQLTSLMASDNLLRNLKELLHFITGWPHLEKLDLHGNPVCGKPRYIDNVIYSAPNLVLLDLKEVPAALRTFVECWQTSKQQRRAQREARLQHDGRAAGTAHWHYGQDHGASQHSATAPGSLASMPSVTDSMMSLSVQPQERAHRSAASKAVHEARTRFPDIFAPSRMLRADSHGKAGTSSSGRRRYESNLFTGTNVPAGIAPSQRQFPSF